MTCDEKILYLITAFLANYKHNCVQLTQNDMGGFILSWGKVLKFIYLLAYTFSLSHCNSAADSCTQLLDTYM